MRWLNENSRKFLERGYLQAGETPESRIMDIAQKAQSILGIEGFADKFYDYVSKGWFSLSSPIWSNFGNNRGLPISCFTSYIDDDMANILYTNAEVGMMSKYGGGTGGYFGDIRARGSEIRGNGKSSGPVHFMQMFESNIDVVSQGSVRRGSFAAYLPVEHPDVLEFLEIRTEGNPIQSLNFGVTVTDKFLKEMEKGDSEKRKIWAKVIKSRSETGMPYIFFTDTVNKNTVDVYKDKGLKIYSSNLCVKGDTKILTDKGYREIKDSIGIKNIWNGEKFSEVEVVKTGFNKELIKVTTSYGNSIECTPYHKFYTQNEYSKKPEKVEAKDLKIGDKLIRFELPTIEGTMELDNAYDNGFYTGDGTELKNGVQRLYAYGDKKKSANKRLNNSIYHNTYKQDSQDREIFETNLLEKKYFIPDSSYTIKSRVKWFEGYSDADGTITNNKGSQSLQIACVNKEFLKELQLMLQTLGVESKISKARDAGEYKLPLNDGSGKNGLFQCQEINRILINGNGLYKLYKLGYKPTRLSFKVKKPNRVCSEFPRITKIEELGGLHDTFCFTEKERGMGMFNGILCGNCSEITLPTNKHWSFVCDLSSLNLVYYDEWKDTDAAKILTYFLDAVMSDFIEKIEKLPEQNKYFMERAYNFAVANRALGIGVFGWHSYLQSKMIPFESSKATELNIEIWKKIKEETYKASGELAKLLGEPSILKGYGRRNTTLIAVAPTTSSAFIIGQASQSIEPFMSNYYVKDLAKSKVTIKNEYLKKLLIEKGQDNKDVWDSIRDNDGSVQHLEFLNKSEKDTFKTFSEINQYAIVDQAADRQKYIDQSQSLNLMISPNTSAKDINALYLDAWKQGVKTLYYQHSKSAAQELSRKISCVGCEA